jgi:hypothetical protein
MAALSRLVQLAGLALSAALCAVFATDDGVRVVFGLCALVGFLMAIAELRG